MQEEAMLNLRWDSFSSQLTNSLDACYEKQCFVDLSLVCKNGTILKCHKMVLSNASSFFRRLLVKNEHPHPMIILHDVEADDLKTIINFMYCGEIQVVKSEVNRILRIAETLEVSGLKDIRNSIPIPEDDDFSKKNLKKSPDVENSMKIIDTKIDRNNVNYDGKNITEDFSNSLVTRLQKKNAPIVTKKIVSINEERCSNEFSKRIENNPKNRCDFAQKNFNIGYEDNVASTSRNSTEISNVGELNAKMKKRKNFGGRVNWNTVLSKISKDDHVYPKRLCLMDEVEITACGSSIESSSNDDEPPDNTETANYSKESESHTDYGIYIKDELDIPYDIESELNNSMEKYDITEMDSPIVDRPIDIFKRAQHITGSVSTSPKGINLFEAKIKGKGSIG